MNVTLLKNLLVLSVIFTAAVQVFSQEQPSTNKKINFGYSRNPAAKPQNPPAKPNGQTAAENNKTEENKTAQEKLNPETKTEEKFESRSVAQKTLDVAKRASTKALPPTEIYKVGIGDVLFISLQNAPAKASTYFTVLNDGTVDYPLAGEMVTVSGLTTDEIEEVLQSKIKIYENPQVSVKVREYASHSITVLGLVEKAGEKFLQREAIPLFVVKAEAIVQPKAGQITIRRANSQIETLDLKDPKSDEVLILPGDIVEFGLSETNAGNSSEPQFYYMGGDVVGVGQKSFHAGLTLTQAILASGGLKKSNVKKVVIRRKNAEGLLIPSEYNLKD
ncbi:MAG TPA: polysaccharide biosynthesis/export family protein, partial [Pyrinomonadaceae bacterium]|nr:polysaccharide biosynthesis/export family protein [Pyrinomonadaceae bacterium]